jgi:hypothetical protein
MSHPSRPAARSVAEVMMATLDPLMRKRGLAKAQLLAWWPDIVGEAYAGSTQPERIKWTRDGSAATLFVLCDPAVSLQLSYEIDRIRERLNGFLGYSAVGAVKIVQRRIGKAAPPLPAPQAAPDPERLRRLDARTEGLDPPLRAALVDLGRAIFARS